MHRPDQGPACPLVTAWRRAGGLMRGRIAAPHRVGRARIIYSGVPGPAAASSVDTPISSSHDPEIMKKKFATIATAAR